MNTMCTCQIVEVEMAIYVVFVCKGVKEAFDRSESVHTHLHMT